MATKLIVTLGVPGNPDDERELGRLLNGDYLLGKLVQAVTAEVVEHLWQQHRRYIDVRVKVAHVKGEE